MFVAEVVLGVIAVLVVAVLLAGLGGDGLPAARPDTDDPVLPTDRLLSSADFATLRFRTAVRGYRMQDVDAVMAAAHAALWAAEHAAASAARAGSAPERAADEAGE